MAPEEKKRRKRATGEPTHAVHAPSSTLKAGEILRETRLAKGLELEEISAAIHVRVGQLKAIEENHLDALPGMTYALGFLKSYAQYLKLDANELATKFKIENGAVPKPVMHSTEPLPESKMPDPFLLGVAGVGVLIVAILWAVFSGGDDEARKIASDIPPAPAIIETAPIPAQPPQVAATPATDSGANDTSAPIATGPLTTPVTPVENIASAPSTGVVAADAATDTATAASPVPGRKPAAASETETAAEPAAGSPQPAPPADADVINVSRGRSRVVLRATQTTWVQVTDASGKVVLKKVLRAGDVFAVPDGAGYSLVTGNAGGIEAVVDGQPKSLGKRGDVLRGVPLTPEALKNTGNARRNSFRE
ncbi:MAG TPA: RodZ domain-containing protein [Patescibacteria group bacterium]|nr:RodZ domain-containing protein [Patescibacteria group bacterium]